MKKSKIKNCTCYYFDGIINFKDFDLLDLLLDEESYQNTLIYESSYKTFNGIKSLCIMYDKVMGLLKTMMELSIYHCLVLKNM